VVEVANTGVQVGDAEVGSGESACEETGEEAERRTGGGEADEEL